MRKDGLYHYWNLCSFVAVTPYVFIPTLSKKSRRFIRRSLMAKLEVSPEELSLDKDEEEGKTIIMGEEEKEDETELGGLVSFRSSWLLGKIT